MALRAQVEALKPATRAISQAYEKLGLEGALGLQVSFASQPDIKLAFESLEYAPNGIELLSLRMDERRTYANVFVPDGKLEHFENYIADYLNERKKANGDALDHLALLNTIESIRAAALADLWTDDSALLPQDPDEHFWWEVWLPVRGHRATVVADFRKMAKLAECRVGEAQVEFPERTVLLAYGSQRQFTRSPLLLNCIAELRLAKETAEFFDELKIDEQRQWADELLRRVRFAGDGDATPRVCLLDSGVTRGHPLLEPLMAAADLHTVVPAWGVDDTAKDGHGTGQATLAAYGDLTDALATQAVVTVGHRLESVKLLPHHGANQGDARHHAFLFEEGVARPEVAAPARTRVFVSAVTASDYRDRGRPSAWSSMVDKLAADYDGQGRFPRLFVQAAGNTKDNHAWEHYPDSLSTNLIHDPGQAWNALTVGAFTEKVDTRNFPPYKPIASAGELSPFTSTSATWDDKAAWPLKPDVVMEGGNAAKDLLSANPLPSLCLLAAYYKPLERLFTTANATSAASALCARMAAQIMAVYPDLRPETIRALIVHSAQWTDAMRAMYLPSGKAPTKTDHARLIRHCGWGVPNLERALWSAGNSLTLVVEDVVHPYAKAGSHITTRDMNLHTLPWPKEALEALQHTPVKMRVTLSYFIEPNPSARGAKSKFYYPSHRLRFDVQHPLDGSTDDFIRRINAAAQSEDESEADNPRDPAWLLGSRQRHRGSLHQDVWEGTAADLASRGFVAVYPAQGWWKSRPKQERYDLPARYSLVVSIYTQETGVDLYNAVEQQIRIAIET